MTIFTEEQLEEAEGYGLPDSPHVEISFDALEDTLDNVSGNESLTQAQHYMAGILNATGAARGLDSVEGSEGFFSRIGEGAQKTWEYIKKMFTSIWGFFFKKEAPAKAETAKKKLEENKTSLNATNVEQAKASVSRAVSVVDESVSKELKEATSKEDILKVAAKVGKANDKARKILGVKAGNFIAVLKASLKVADDAKAEAAELGQADYIAFASNMVSNKGMTETMIKELEPLHGLEDLSKAKAVTEKMTGYLAGLTKAVTSISSTEGHVKSSIEKIEKSMGADDEQAKKQLAGLRKLMVAASKYSKLMKDTLDYIPSVSKSVNSVFGL